MLIRKRPLLWIIIIVVLLPGFAFGCRAMFVDRNSEGRQLSIFDEQKNTTSELADAEPGNDSERLGVFELISLIKTTSSDTNARYQINEGVLNTLRGVRPRILIDAGGIERLKEAAKTTHATRWNLLKQMADEVAATPPTEYYESGQKENNWMRDNGRNLTVLTLAYKISEDERYFNAAVDWALKTCEYPKWGANNNGLSLAEIVFGLAVFYDWCYDELDSKTQSIILETVIDRVSVMARYINGKSGSATAVNGNHPMIYASGLAAIGLAIYDEYEEAMDWIQQAVTKYNHILTMIGNDGATTEGVSYWGYGVQYMLAFAEMADKLLGIHLYELDFFENMPYFRIFSSVPHSSWNEGNTVMSFDDANRADFHGADHMLSLLAGRYNNGYAQWLANKLFADGAQHKTNIYSFFNMLWYNPDVQETSLSDLPTIWYFDNVDFVYARSDWSGDESVVAFKSGPPTGYTMLEKQPLMGEHFKGSGHTHPDANHFILYGNGDWLIRDDGYVSKHTAHHNTLLVDGKGQIGEGDVWLDIKEYMKIRETARITTAETCQMLDYIVGDATAAYPEVLGLKKFKRHLLFVKPDVLLVIDDIEVDNPKPLELRFFPEQFYASRQEDGSYLITGPNSRLQFSVLTKDEVNIKAEDIMLHDKNNKPKNLRLVIRLQKDGVTQWRNAVALSWSSKSSLPKVVSLEQEEDLLKFSIENKIITLDLSTDTVEMSENYLEK